MPFDYKPSLDSPIDFKALEEDIDININTASVDDLSDLWDAINKRIDKAKYSVKELEKELKKIKDINPDSESIGEFEKKIEELNNEISKTPKLLNLLSSEFADASNTSVRFLSGLTNLSASLSPEDWVKYAKTVKLSSKQIENLSKNYYKSAAVLRNSKEALASYQNKLMSGQTITKEEINNILDLRKAAFEASEQINLLEISIDDISGVLENKFSNGIDDGINKLGLLNKTIEEAKFEADRFGGGIGESATGLLAAGVSIVFVADKIKELGESLEDTQSKMAEYNVKTAIAAKTIPNFTGGIKGLEELRHNLHMTSDEAIQFQDVLKEGTASSVVNINELVESAKKLEETFGEDPTDRLRQYVDLLKSIPTLETDISITASLDDQSAAWFALAESGKVQQVIEMQMAGLLGGEGEGLGPDADIAVETLKVQNKIESTQSSIEKMISDWIPSWTGYVTKSIAAGFVIGGSISTLVSSSAATVYLLNKILKTNQKIANEGISGGNVRTRVDINKDISNAIFSGFKKYRGGMKMTGAIRGAGLGMESAGVGAGAYGVGISAIGGSLSALTTNVSALSSTVSGVTTTAGAFGAGLTKLLGPLVAAVGPFIAVKKIGADVGEFLKEFGERIKDTKLDIYLDIFGKEFFRTSSALDWFSDKLIHAGTTYSLLSDDVYNYIVLGEKGVKLKQDEYKKDIKRFNLAKKQIVSMSRQQNSALALQRTMEYLKSAVESPITSLAKMQTEFASLKLDSLSHIGGNVDDFYDSLSNGAVGLRRELGQMEKSFGYARDMVVSDSKMTSEHRRIALMKIHKMELEATTNFANNLMKIVGRFKDIPEIFKNTLDTSMKEVFEEINVEAASDILNSSSENIIGGLDNVVNSIISSTKVLPKEFKNIYESGEELSKRNKINSSELKSAINNISSSLDNVNKQLVVEITKKLDFTDKNVKVDQKVDAAPVMEAAKKLRDNAQKGIDEIDSSISDFAEQEWFTSLDKAKKKVLEAEKPFDDLNNELKDLYIEHDKIAKASASAKKIKDGAKAYNDLMDETSSLMKYSNTLAGQIANLATEYVANSKESLDLAKVKRDIAKKELELEKIDKSELSNAKEELNKYQNLIINYGKKQVMLGKEELKENETYFDLGTRIYEKQKRIREEKNKEHALYDAQKDIASKVLGVAKQSNFALEATNEVVKNSYEQYKQFFSYMDKLTDIESRPNVKKAKRRLELAEEEGDLSVMYGNAMGGLSKELDANRVYYDTMIKASNEAIKKLEDFKKGGETRDKMLVSTYEAMSGVNKEIENIFNEKISKNMIDAFGGKEAIDKVQVTLQDSATKVNASYKNLIEAYRANSDEKTIQELANKYIEDSNIYNKKLSDIQATAKSAGMEFPVDELKNFQKLLIGVVDAVSGKADENYEKEVVRRNKLIVESYTSSVEKINKRVQDIDSQPLEKYVSALESQTDSMFELADATLDANMATKARAAIVSAIEKEHLDVLKQVNDSIKDENENYKKIVENYKNKTISEEQYQLATQLHLENIANAEKKRYDAELKNINKTKSAIENEFKISYDILSLKQDELDIQKDILEFTGASYDYIIKAQQADIQLARERASIMAKELEEMKNQGQEGTQEYEKKRLDLIKAQVDVQKKALGAQRDAYDKLMEKQFGSIRSSRGARRQLMTDAQVFGSGYVKTRSGMIVSGGAKSISQRQASFATTTGKDYYKTASKEETAADKMKESSLIFSGAVSGFNSIMMNLTRNNLGLTSATPVSRGAPEAYFESAYNAGSKSVSEGYIKSMGDTSEGTLSSGNVPYSVLNPVTSMSTSGELTNQVPIGGSPINSISGNSIGGSGTQNINAKVNAVLTVDAEGNIGAYIKKIVNETVPSVIRSPNGQAALDQAGVLRRGQQ